MANAPKMHLLYFLTLTCFLEMDYIISAPNFPPTRLRLLHTNNSTPLLLNQ